MPKFIKKPVVIEAVKWSGNNYLEVINLSVEITGQTLRRSVSKNRDKTLTIRTLEGDMTANIGDYIIRGVKDEIYPCKPDIFEATYKKVEE